MSLVALAKGVSNVSWARVWLDVAKQSQCLLEGAPEGSPLLQQPLVSGQWSGIPIKNCSFAKWVTSILALRGMGEGITGHSAKRTALFWASKAGVSERDRAILGHHSGTLKSVASYSRDLQAGPLRRLAEVYGDIRSGRFKPDLSRSGYYDCQSFDAPTQHIDAPNFPDPPCAGESSSWDVACDKGGQDSELDWYNSSLEWNDVDDLISEACERAMSEPAVAKELPRVDASDSAAQMAKKSARTAVRAAAPVARPPVARIWMMPCRLPRSQCSVGLTRFMSVHAFAPNWLEYKPLLVREACWR